VPKWPFSDALWDPTAVVRYDQQLWNELTTLRFAEAGHGALILGPVGVGKTHLATALGHIAVRRRLTVAMGRADQLFKKLKAARLDNSTDTEHRRLDAVNVLIIDDFALQPLDETATADFNELIVARHRKNATIVTSNRTPDEWVTLMSDPLLAQPSTGSPPPATSSSSRASPTAAASGPPTPQLDETDHPPQDDPAAARWSLGRGNTWSHAPGKRHNR
jgi:IstB-like ATP binding protein